VTDDAQVIYIYALYDETDERLHPDWRPWGDKWIRYIGRAHTPEKRLTEHLHDSKKNNKTRKQKWIRSVLKERSVT
jgi:hypothetical protein